MRERRDRGGPTAAREIGAFALFIAVLHLVGWGVIVVHAGDNASIVGLGVAAYLLGLRHAFDVDHIAAVDDTVRFMLQRRRSPVGVGFYFSLGHSTVVFVVALVLAIASTAFGARLPALRELGETWGAGVSGLFLLLIGLLNLRVLIGLARARLGRLSGHDHTHIDQLLLGRGVRTRMVRRCLKMTFDRSWQMYPVGVLFGLGFDTASEISLLTMTAGASATVLPFAAVMALPVLFAAGMLAVDTTDGVLMCKAYNWAVSQPLRRITYNLLSTGASVMLALFVGSVELVQLWLRHSEFQGTVGSFFRHFEFGAAGYVATAFLLGLGGVFYLLHRIPLINLGLTRRAQRALGQSQERHVAHRQALTPWKHHDRR